MRFSFSAPLAALLLLLTFLPACTRWTEVGKIDDVIPRGISVNLGFNTAGIPHVGIQARPNRPVVARFENDRWSLLPNVPAGGFLVAFQDFGMQGDVPYVVVRLGTNNLEVSRFENGAWVDLSFPWPGTVARMAFRDGKPCVIFRRSGGAEDGRAVVSCRDGVQWPVLGGNAISAGNVNYISLAVGSDNSLFAAYRDEANGGRATVLKYSTAWQAVGPPGFSPDQAEYIAFILDAAGRPFTVFTDQGEGRKLTSMAFNGTAWQLQGRRGFTPGRAIHGAMVLNERNRPVVVYHDQSQGDKASAREFETDNVWRASGPPGFTSGALTERIGLARRPEARLMMAATLRTDERPVVMEQ